MVLVACGNQQKTQQDIVKDWSTYETNDYSIKYPRTWALNQSGFMGTSFLIISKQTSIRDFYQENAGLVEVNLNDGRVDLSSYVANALDSLKNAVEQFKVLENELVNYDKGTYQKVLYIGIEANTQVAFLQHYFIKDSKAYELKFSCKIRERERYLPIGEAILNSFQLK